MPTQPRVLNLVDKLCRAGNRHAGGFYQLHIQLDLVACDNSGMLDMLYRRPLILALHFITNASNRKRALYGTYDIATLFGYLPDDNTDGRTDKWQNLIETNHFYLRCRGTLLDLLIPEGQGLPKMQFMAAVLEDDFRLVGRHYILDSEAHKNVRAVDNERMRMTSILHRIGKKTIDKRKEAAQEYRHVLESKLVELGNSLRDPEVDEVTKKAILDNVGILMERIKHDTP